jgi:hypothetical protein
MSSCQERKGLTLPLFALGILRYEDLAALTSSSFHIITRP